jgi:hypothetical protein
MAIRSDRDLLDLIAILHGFLRENFKGEEMEKDSEGRVRKGLKVHAFYAKVRSPSSLTKDSY